MNQQYTTQHCTKCALATLHSPKNECLACAHRVPADKYRKLHETLRAFTNRPAQPADHAWSEHHTVYLKHHHDESMDGKKQLSQTDVHRHITLTGTVPEVGKPVFTAGPTIDGVAIPVPFGEVVEIQ